mmetsp:Transcript_5276/g.5417  ORF Transcript_5276/g.5417 Transcript_5276/m.5417 type:complete len:180 (+) Transcript_5276:283-822(+)
MLAIRGNGNQASEFESFGGITNSIGENGKNKQGTSFNLHNRVPIPNNRSNSTSALRNSIKESCNKKKKEVYFTDDTNVNERVQAETESQENYNPATARTPKSMRRAKSWNPIIENSYRYQLAGFRDEEEYLSKYPHPDTWPDSGFVKCLRSKQNGYYMYFRPHRECADKHLNKIKIYEY